MVKFEDIQRDILLIIVTAIFIFLTTGFTVARIGETVPIIVPTP